MLKVLQVINSLSSGGAEVFVAQLSVALSEKCNVKLLTYAGELDAKGLALKQYLLDNGVAYDSLNAVSKLERILVPFKLADEINKWQPDIVHVHINRSEQFVYLAGLFTTHNFVPVRTKHDELPYPAFFLNGLLNRFYKQNIACSESAYVPFVALRLQQKTVVIKNGIEINTTNNNSHKCREELRLRLGLPINSIILLNIGSMHYEGTPLQKAQDVILNALPKLSLNSHYHVVFLGGGNALDTLKNMASTLCLDKLVTFKGIVSNVQDYLNCADVFVMPSRWEGLPIAGIEAACSGLPLILSEIDSFNEFFSKSVIKCEVNSAESLAYSIDSVMENLPIFSANALAAMSDYQARFSIQAVADKHVDIYQGLL